MTNEIRNIFSQANGDLPSNARFVLEQNGPAFKVNDLVVKSLIDFYCSTEEEYKRWIKECRKIIEW